MYEYTKRACDIMLSALALLVLSPLLASVAVLLKLTGEHYIFYAQERVGRGGKPFRLLKFATMLKQSPTMGTGDMTLRNDPRVLPVGRFLRKMKINELPQLINVLKGDMSLIGPRPLTPNSFSYYSEEVQAIIGRIKPGLSGIGSLAFRNEEDMVAESGLGPAEFYRQHIARYKGGLEAWYAEHRSTTLDLLIILLTLSVVVFPRNRLHMKLLGDLPRPDSAILARCLGLPPRVGTAASGSVDLHNLKPAKRAAARGLSTEAKLPFVPDTAKVKAPQATVSSS